MRLWSLHPSYLDAKGLVALWREGLLARNVLHGNTKGYKNHPQLDRFKALNDPKQGIDAYLSAVLDESFARGYTFTADKIVRPESFEQTAKSLAMTVTDGQLAHEVEHLKKKLEIRDPSRLETLIAAEKTNTEIKPHPLFLIIKGGIADWERNTDAQYENLTS